MSISTLTTLTTKVRYILEDYAKSQSDIFTFATSRIFTLEESNPVTVSTVYINDVELPDTDWSYSSGKVTIEDSLSSGHTLSSGDTVQIDYTAYENFSSNEVTSAIRSTLYYLSINNFYDFIVDEDDDIQPDPNTKEERVIAIIAAYKLRPEYNSLRMPDFSISKKDALTFEDFVSKVVGYEGWNNGIFNVLE